MIKMEPSTFDFDSLAETYDRWYDTAEVAMYDLLEKQAIANLFSKNVKGELE